MAERPPGDLRQSAVIVLLAAGEARRYGSAKQLAQINSEPMVRRVARMALVTAAPVIVVTGARAVEVEAVLVDLPLQLLRHDAWRDGMGSSLAAGIRYAQAQFPKASAALLCLADQPMIGSSTLSLLLERHRNRPARIVAAIHAGIVGPPVLFPRGHFTELAALSGDQGARTLLRREVANVEYIALDASQDVDTPADLRHVKLQLAADRKRAVEYRKYRN